MRSMTVSAQVLSITQHNLAAVAGAIRVRGANGVGIRTQPAAHAATPGETMRTVDEAGSPAGDFLGELEPEAATELRRLGTRRTYPAGSALFLEGDGAREAIVLLRGEVKLSVGSLDGGEVILDVLKTGSLVGELSVIDGRPRSATVTAISTVEVLAVPAAAFNDFLEAHPRVMRRLLVEVIDRLRTRVRHQLEFGTGDAMGRICARLAELADRHGTPRDGSVSVHSPLTQSELAAWAGLSREAVVKVLRTLRQLGWVENRGRTITIHELDRVRERAAR
jgi:CRP/FNR family transcriptional regulator, cyclic AMP receptor protein